MIEQFASDTNACLAFRVSGEVTKSDYDVLRPAVEASLTDSNTISLLLDLTDFHKEKAEAWRSDLAFGRDFHNRISRLAIVGPGAMEAVLAAVAHPFYASESKHFDTVEEAWGWLDEKS